MKYVQPIGAAVNAPYFDANPGLAIEGSPVPAAAIEHPMREIEALITAAGLVPATGDLTQLAKAIQSGKLCSSASGGTADAIIGVFAPGITALTNGMALYVRSGSANATTAPTFTPNNGTIAAKAIVKGAGTALAAGDIAGGGHWIELRYDLTLDKWVLLNPANGIIVVSGVPAGAVCYFPATTAPTGWIKANGALLSRTTYAALYAYALASGNIVAEGSWQAGMFSTGDLATTFRIPDGRGEFLRGWDDVRGVDAARAIGTAQAGDLQSHLHTFQGFGGSSGTYASGALGQNGVATSSTGGTETRPRNVAQLACIKY